MTKRPSLRVDRKAQNRRQEADFGLVCEHVGQNRLNANPRVNLWMGKVNPQ